MRYKELPHLNDRVGFHAFIREVSHRTGKTIIQCDPIVRAVFDTIKHNIYNNNWVSIPHFGTYYTYPTKGRLINLVSGEKLWSESHLIPKMSWSGKFKTQIRKVVIDERKDIQMEDSVRNSE